MKMYVHICRGIVVEESTNRALHMHPKTPQPPNPKA